MYRKLIVTLLLAFALPACDNRPQEAADTQIAAEQVPVRVSSARQMEIVKAQKITGEIAPFWEVDVFPTAAGKIIAKYADLGKTVRQGQVLAEFMQDIPGLEFSSVKIEASRDGVVTLDLIEIGTKVTPQTPVFRISKLDPIYMIARVIESALGKIRIGDVTQVRVDAYPNESFQGKIAELSPTVDRLSRMATIKIQINNPQARLKPGMFATSQLTLGKHTGVVVPLEAVIRTGTQKYVYRIIDEKAQLVSLETGAIVGDQIEAISRVEPGDQIVSKGQNLLQDGAAVRIVKE